MKLTVFGATGGTGRQLVDQALARGHQVTAVVRDPARLPVSADALDVVAADVMDPGQIESLVSGRAAVLSALGSHGRGPTTVTRDAARSIGAAMRSAGTRRLLVVSAAALHRDNGDGPVTRYLLKPVVSAILRDNYADLRAMEGVVAASELDYTIVVPPRLTNGRAIGRVRSAIGRNVRGGTSIRRADLAGWMLDAIDAEALLGAKAFIAN